MKKLILNLFLFFLYFLELQLAQWRTVLAAHVPHHFGAGGCHRCRRSCSSGGHRLLLLGCGRTCARATSFVARSADSLARRLLGTEPEASQDHARPAACPCPSPPAELGPQLGGQFAGQCGSPCQPYASSSVATVCRLRRHRGLPALRSAHLRGLQGILQADGPEGLQVCVPGGQELSGGQEAAESLPVLPVPEVSGRGNGQGGG